MYLGLNPPIEICACSLQMKLSFFSLKIVNLCWEVYKLISMICLFDHLSFLYISTITLLISELSMIAFLRE